MLEESTSTAVEQAQSNGLPPEAQQSFQNAIWGELDTPAQTETPAAETVTETPAATTTTEKKDEPLETEAWIKKEFNVDNAEALRQQLNEYKELKEKPTTEYKFENEDSKRLAEAISKGDRKEIRKILNTQAEIEELVSVDVNDDTADSIIKLGMKLKYKEQGLTETEINHKFNKQYGIPKEPIKGEFEGDTEFEEKHEAWKERVAEIKMDKIIEAKTMKPELLKANSELKLPEISKDNNGKQEQSPEDLVKFEQAKTTFLQSAKQTVEGFNGFNVQVKDKDVDFSVGYTPSIEEKNLVTEKLNLLAESGFDANAIFAERWYDNATQTFNTEQMTKDLSRMLIGENADKKLAFDSANKRMEAFLKEKKNVIVNEGNKDSTFKPNETATSSEKLAADFWGKN